VRQKKSINKFVMQNSGW